MNNEKIKNYEKYKSEFLLGTSLEKLGKKYNFCPYRFGKVLKLDGVIINKNNQKYKYNNDFFEYIDTEEKAYWLGFIYADGYIGKTGRTLEIGLKASDKKHLHKITKVICPDLSVTHRKINKHSACRVIMSSKDLVTNLIKHGCVNAKSMIITFPNIPKDLTRHFLRGYFDGDGCISGQLISFHSGSLVFLETIQKLLKENIEGYSEVTIHKDKRSNSRVLQKGTINVSLPILKWLYADSSVYLDRKYRKFLKLLSRRPTKQLAGAQLRKKSGKPKGQSEVKGNHRLLSRNA